MNKALLIMMMLAMVSSVAAQNESMDPVVDDGMAGGGAMEGGPEEADEFNYMPIVVFVALTAIVFAIAKYGP